MKPWAEAFYKSKDWQKCRAAYIDERIPIDGGLCEECHERVGVIVHHKETLTELNIGDPEITLNHELLELVCKECHDQFEGHGVTKSGILPMIQFGADGQPMVQTPPFRR
jgi:hypothetical protein